MKAPLPHWPAVVLTCLVALPCPAAAQPVVKPALLVTTDALTNVAGGLAHGGDVLTKIDASLSFDGYRSGARGWTGHVSVQHVSGRFSDRFVGDAQVVSNIEATGALRLFEGWVGYAASDRLTFKAGLIDLNSEFDQQEAGKLFLNASHGIGADFSQTGENGPSIFPTAAGAVFVRYATGNWTVRLGAFDGVAGSPTHPRRTVASFPGRRGGLLIGEVARAIGRGHGQIGVWTYTSRFDHLDKASRSRRGNHGGYALLQQRILDFSDERGIDLWVRAGAANPKINTIAVYAGGGMVADLKLVRLGIGVAHARTGRTARMLTPLERAETSTELTAAFRLNDHVHVQPELQWIVNPSWRQDLGDAVVLGLRVILSSFDT